MNIITPFNNAQHRSAVIALWRTVFGYESAHNAPAAVIDKKLAVQDGLFFVALDKHTVIGTVMAGYDGHRGWLYSVAVHPDSGRCGVGTQLVRHAEQALAALGCMKINLQLLDTNHAVAGFYQALGYSAEPRVSMGRVLAMNLPDGK
jgi:ribosomal protein S18 acetylase RimI-like enzyme